MMKTKCLRVFWLVIFLLGGWSPQSLSQLTPDTTLEVESSQIQSQGNRLVIEGGAQRGTVLLHSFEQFNIDESQSVFFANPANIDLIIGRVTGHGNLNGANLSRIDGTLGVLGLADLFLLNPNGIVFGPNAQLSLPGSFTASTADSIRIGETIFSAVTPSSVPLLTINVPAGLQLGPNSPERIIQNQANLTLSPEQQLTFDGGSINHSGNLSIPGGTVELRGQVIRSPGTITTRAADNTLGVLRFISPADLTIQSTAPLTNQAIAQALQNNAVSIQSSGDLNLVGALTSTSTAPLTLAADNNLTLISDGSGDIQLAGNVILQSGGNLSLAQSLSVINSQANPLLSLQAGGDVVIQGSFDPAIGVTTLQLTGNQGRLSIQANDFNAFGARIFTFTNGGGLGPTVNITASQNLITQSTAIATQADNGQTGGAIRLSAGNSVQIRQGIINSLLPENGSANTGDIDIQAEDSILLEGGLVFTTAAGNSGDITLRAPRITLDGSVTQSLIGAGTRIGSIGNAGNVTLNATESVELIGFRPGPFIFQSIEQLNIDSLIAEGFGNTTIEASAFGLGSSGVIRVNTDQLTIRDGALVANATGLFDSVGEAGDIIINARDIQLRGLAVIATGTVGPAEAGELSITSDRITLNDGASIGVSSLLGAGDAGQLNIRAQDLTVSDGSVIAANTVGAGDAGTLNIRAQTITVEGTSADGSFPSTLATDAFTTATGAGGELQLRAENTLQVLNGGQVRVGTQGPKAAGTLSITAGQVTINGTSTSGIPSTLEAQSTGSGSAGTLDIIADQLTVSDRANISTQSQQGSGGDINLILEDALILRQQSQISSTAGTGGTGGTGGNINIAAGFIIAPSIENSDITANAFAGTGGNITIQANTLLGIAFREDLTPISDITASSEFGLNGTVTIEPQTTDLNTEPAELPESFIDPNDRLIAGCRLDEDANFIVTGRGGIAANPRERLNQALIWQDPRNLETGTVPSSLENTALENTALTNSEEKSETISEAQSWRVNPQGNIELIANAQTHNLLQAAQCSS